LRFKNVEQNFNVFKDGSEVNLYELRFSQFPSNNHSADRAVDAFSNA